jgi:hypothetical protein
MAAPEALPFAPAGFRAGKKLSKRQNSLEPHAFLPFRAGAEGALNRAP